MKNIAILGAGGYGRTVADICEQSLDYQKIIYLDDNSNLAVGTIKDYVHYQDFNIYPAFGNNEMRMQWIHKLEEEGYSVPTIIHDSAYISPSAKLETGIVVLPRALINTDCYIGKGCIINCGAIIDHGCVIEDGCHICLGAIVKGENQIPTMTKIEAGEVVPTRKYKVDAKR